ncbi:MAG: hypothetical protein HRU19_28695 [Pseudobacteriovorax sp.]|nr:hypothetical protein [Pseudobacteriovorax sp.]
MKRYLTALKTQVATVSLAFGITSSAYAIEGASQGCGRGFTQIFSFGDSLSDAGVLFDLATITKALKVQAIPARDNPGGFSNKKNWVQLLTDLCGLGHQGEPYTLAWPNTRGTSAISGERRGITAKDKETGNFAYGGAYARSVVLGVPSFDKQIDLFSVRNSYLGLDKSYFATKADEILYVVQFSVNDVFEELTKYRKARCQAVKCSSSEISVDDFKSQDSVKKNLPLAAKGIANGIRNLYQNYGAKNFLVLSSPDLSLTPWTESFGLQSVADYASSEMNRLLEAEITKLSSLNSTNQYLDISRPWKALVQKFDNKESLSGPVAKIFAPSGTMKFRHRSSCQWDMVNGKKLENESDFCKPGTEDEYATFDGNHPTCPLQEFIARKGLQLLKDKNLPALASDADMEDNFTTSECSQL